MRQTPNTQKRQFTFSTETGKRQKIKTAAQILMLLGALLLVANPARANLLSNGGFDAPPGSFWTTWTYSGGWANLENDASSFDAYYMAVGGSGGSWYSSGGGVYQVIVGNPGIPYTLSVESGAQPWWWPHAWMSISFLDASDAVLSSTNFETTTGITGYDTGLAWSNYTMIAVSPPGTAKVKVEFANHSGTGTAWFDNAVLTAPVPAITDVYPDGTVLMQATDTLSFAASADAAITNIQVVLNGADVSSNLVVTGSSTSKAVTYSGLKTNQFYTGTITVTDANNLRTAVPVSFDTLNPTFLWEAEDFDYTNGLYINNPALSSTDAPNSYFGVVGTQGVDENDIGHNGPELFRTNDFMSTDLAGDTARQNFLTAQATDPAIKDYAISYFDTGEWVNYTRNFPAGKYNVYARLASGDSGVSTMYLDKVISGQGTPAQTTSPLGSFKYTGTGWNSYQYAPLSDTYGNLVAVDLSGVTTLRVTAGVGNMNFFLLVPAQLDLPVIANVYPDGTVLMQPTNQLSFSVTSPSATIPDSGIQVTLNGTDVSASLAITGSSTSKSVNLTGLKTNTAYTAVIHVTDANGSSASSTIHFDTFVALFLWEAEDWDFSGGQYINDPVPSSAPVANSYFGQIGTQGVDENETETDPANLYRSGDTMNAGPCGDVPRQKFLDAKVGDPNVQDWNVGYFDAGEWVNYTRDFPAGTYNIYARLANGNGGTATVYLDKVTSGQTTPSQGTESLGSFQFPAQGWSTYSYVPLRDRFGNVAEVTLSGVTTLRAIGGGANMNFFMLATPRNDLPRITDVYPDGTLELQSTNSFRFTASNPTVPIYSTNISLTLNNVDVTSQLTLSGSPSSWNVSIPLALNSARYTAVITVRDANTNVTSATVYFDTFNPTNFTWEAEDYDFTYSGVSGQFIDNPTPTSTYAANSYFGQDATYGVDYYYEVSDPATPYTNYNRFSLGVDVCGDYPPLAKYVTAQLTDPNVKDYNLAYWTSNSWANYTRTYPSGTYNVFARMASGMGGSIQLDKITVGATNHLGQFDLPNWGWGVYSWWPLVDGNGQLVTVTLNGVTTLRATTDGSANANRYMLVTPLAQATAPQITATASGGSVVLRFPTQDGHLYQVWAKNNLPDATWTQVGAVSGDGSVKSWSESATQASRFYRLIVQ